MLSAKLKARADDTYQDLDYSGSHKKTDLIIVLLYNVLKYIPTNTL